MKKTILRIFVYVYYSFNALLCMRIRQMRGSKRLESDFQENDHVAICVQFQENDV